MNPTPTPPLHSNTRPLFEPRPIGCALMESDGRIVSATRSFALTLGFQSKSLFGQSIFDLLKSQDNAKPRSLLNEGEPIRVSDRDGRLFGWSVYRIAPGFALSGYYVGLICDETDWETFECRLAHHDRLATLGCLTAEMAHEIAGPLNVIANNAELLLEEERMDQESRRFLSIVRDEAQRLGELLQEFLDFARDAPLRMNAQDIVKIVETPIRLLRHQRNDKRVSVEIRAEPDLPLVAVDGERLQQVVFNLVKNACDASPEGGEVLILVQRTELFGEAAIELAVIDQGEGISSADIEHIFEPFYSSKPAGRGTGLGLCIAQRIIAAHHGDLRITSLDGQGTRASVLLPVLASCNSGKGKNLLV
jgi:nitrogen-specific signal transduction histidine kinase